MFLDRWRARRAIATRTPPSTVNDPADPRLLAAVEALKAAVDAPNSMGDPCWHFRWEGALQLVGLDASSRSTADVRQRLLRLVHECDLRHMHRLGRRVLAVVLCRPAEGEGLAGWLRRLEHDPHDENGDWRAAHRRVAVLALTPQGEALLSGGDREIRRNVQEWLASRPGAR